jgi:hypothetical protein
MVEPPEPGAAIVLGLNAAVVPVGKPDAVSEMVLLKPPTMVDVIVVVPWLPCWTLTEVGEAESVKPGAM